MTGSAEIYTDAPTPVQLIAVCHTDSCPAEAKECPGTYYPYGEHTPPRYMGQCGACQQPITDLRPATTSTEPPPGPGQADTPAPTPVPVEPSTPEGAA
ncbi:hypothetical protein ACGFZR_24850 [Streptomyces sp. NPDC048241]|uniref:hypothetical protein n=1 Tax=Streptomyces sp. NPDC048241 TaxID=3365521 RepID=UPI00370FE1C2